MCPRPFLNGYRCRKRLNPLSTFPGSYHLYGVGLGGGIDVARIHQALEAEADELFKERGQNPVINKRCSRIGDLRKERINSELRAADYSRLREALGNAESSVTELQRQVQAQVAEKSRHVRARDAVPLLAKLASLNEEREELAVPETFGEADAQRVAAMLAELRERRTVRAEVTKQTENDCENRDGIEVDEGVLAVDQTIDVLYQGLDRIKAHQRDLPERRREAEERQRKILANLAELKPDWDMNRLAAWKLEDVARRAFDVLVSDHDDLVERRREGDTMASATADQLEEKRGALAVLAEPAEVTDLLARLDGWDDCHAQRRELARLDEILDSLSSVIAEERRALDPPWPWSDGGEPEKLPVPRKPKVEEQRASCEDLAARRQRLKQKLAEVRDERDRINDELEGRQAALELPSPQDRADARKGRDQQWQTIRSAWLNGETIEEPVATADEYERRVAETDNVADRMYDHAESVAGRQQKTVRVRQLGADEAELKELLDGLAQEEVAWQEGWEKLWERAGIAPDPAAVMLAWLAGHEKLVEHCRERDEHLLRRNRLVNEVATYEEDLRRAVGASTEWTIDAVRRNAEARCREAESLVRDRKRLSQEIDELGRRRAREIDELDAMDGELREWRERWQNALADVGLDAVLEVRDARHLPAELRGLRSELSDVEQTWKRVAGMEDDLAGYRNQVARPFDPTLVSLPLEEAIGTLHRRWEEEAKAKEQRDRLDERIAEAEEKLRVLDQELAPLKAEHQELLSKAGVENDSDLEKTAKQVQQAADLDEKIRHTFERLKELRPAPKDQERFVAMTEQTPEILEHQISVLDSEIDRLNVELAEQQQAVGEARAAVNAHDGSSRASELELDLQTERASLAAEARRFAVLKLAEKLLVEEMGRFEADHQPALLQRAGELFSRLTKGSYTAVRHRLGSNDLVALDSSEKALSPEQLSTGTRQQLYLALRLAYIDHYARQSEPLPIILDDVLVNFDDARALAALEALNEFGEAHQVLFLTCHEHLVEMARQVKSDLASLEIAAS